MGLLLMSHLGATVGFLASLPYGKFTHGPFRAAALLRAVMERQTPVGGGAPTGEVTLTSTDIP